MEKEINVTGISENISDAIDKDILGKDKILEEPELLKQLRVGISISDSPDLMRLGYSAMHLQDASVEFARYLLVHGATMVYGGDLRKKEGFTYLFSELAKLYSSKERQNKYHFKNYFAWPVHLKLDKSDELDFKQNRVEIVKMPPPDFLNIHASEFLEWDTIESKTIWAKSLTYMREKMNGDCDARIFLGGLTRHFRGKYPGIIEEALYALRDNKPVYFIGAYGGATKEIINLLTGQSPEVISEGYQILDKGYKEFYEHWNSSGENKIDYDELARFFKGYGLRRICDANGLNEEENLRLFSSNNLAEMIYYVLKGLTAVF